MFIYECILSEQVFFVKFRFRFYGNSESIPEFGELRF